MASPPLQTRVLRVLLALVLVCVAGWYSPLAPAAIWRLFHPTGWVNYRGLRVRVPWPWIANTDATGEDPSAVPQGMALKKTPFAVNHRSMTETIFVTVISQDPGITAEGQTEAWMETFRMTHPGDTFDTQTPKAIPAGASCTVARDDQKQNDAVWTCISIRGGWVANYEGCWAGASEFFDMLTHLRR